MKASRSKLAKAALALDHCIRSPGLAKKTLASLYNSRIVSHGSIPTIDIPELVGVIPEVRLVNFMPEHGNVTPLELLCICLMIKAFMPKQVLELGTFNGNTALQIAANLMPGARLATLDLPIGAAPAEGNDEHDGKLIRAATREQPRFVGSGYEDRVTQIFGNSLEMDFSSLSPISPEFIFIDAGHSDECVRNDTEKSLKVLAAGGCIVWHDYTQDWPDVFNYLNELAGRLSLRHLHGTNLVVYQETRR